MQWGPGGIGLGSAAAYSKGMIDRTMLGAYIDLKQRIAEAITVPNSGFRPSMRHASEGLAKSFTVAGEIWSYSTHPNGYAFTNGERGYSVIVSDEPERNAAFTSTELVAYLSAFTEHKNLNQLVVDMWLVRAEMEGVVQSAPGLPGHWQVRDPSPAESRTSTS